MKKILLSLLAVGAIFTANAQMKEGAQARVYAYGLDYTTESMAVNGSTVTCYDITFKTNTAATSAYVTLKDAAGTEVAKIDAKSGDSKNWTAEVNVTVLPHDIVAGTYNWEVTATAPAVTSYAQLNQNGPDFSIFRSYGLAVDQSPNSANFGRTYVACQKAGEGQSGNNAKNNKVGIYTYNAELNIENEGNVYECSIVGDGTSTGTSPRDMNIDAEGNLYLVDYTTTNAGIYLVNPNDYTTATSIFGGTIDTNTGDTKNSSEELILGRPAAVGVYGTGKDRVIYAIDTREGQEKLNTEYAVYSVSRYDIGTSTEWTTTPTWTAYEFTGMGQNITIINSYCSIEPIKTGGFWVAQNRETTATGNPAVFYCNKNGVVEYSSQTATGAINSKNGALAVCEDLGLVAFSQNANIGVMSYTINDDNTITVGDVTTYKLPIISRSDAMAFDYAGNLFVVDSNNEAMVVLTIPTTNNTRTTPAKKSLTIEITSDDIATGVDNIAVDANAPVEYYNLQGVKVENPSNGIFIKKQGNKTTKVVL